MTRKVQIHDRLVAFCRDEIHIYCSDVAAADWRNLPLAHEYRFGWMPPIDLDGDVSGENIIALISSDMIDQVTTHLDDADLDVYLTTVELTLSFFLEHRGEPAEEVQEALNDFLWDKAKVGLHLRTDVEMHALDVGIVPVVGA